MNLAHLSTLAALALILSGCGEQPSPQSVAPTASSSPPADGQTGQPQSVTEKADGIPPGNAVTPDDPALTKVRADTLPTRRMISVANTQITPLPVPVTEADMASGPDKDARFAKDSASAHKTPLSDPKSKESQTIKIDLVTKGNAAAKSPTK